MRILRLAEAGAPGIWTAVRTGAAVTRSQPGAVVAPLKGGIAALAVGAPVVSYATAALAEPVSALERLQARRSRLIFAGSRQDAVAIALRLGLGPTRFRITPGGAPDDDLVARELGAWEARRRKWHSA